MILQDLIHMRHFGTQYCDKKIFDKKIILRHRFLLTNLGKLFKKHTLTCVLFMYLDLFICPLAFRHPWLKNILLSHYCASKCLVWIRPKAAENVFKLTMFLPIFIQLDDSSLNFCVLGKFVHHWDLRQFGFQFEDRFKQSSLFRIHPHGQCGKLKTIETFLIVLLCHPDVTSPRISLKLRLFFVFTYCIPITFWLISGNTPLHHYKPKYWL